LTYTGGRIRKGIIALFLVMRFPPPRAPISELFCGLGKPPMTGLAVAASIGGFGGFLERAQLQCFKPNLNLENGNNK
jgi:hypothetical protein